MELNESVWRQEIVSVCGWKEALCVCHTYRATLEDSQGHRAIKLLVERELERTDGGKLVNGRI